MSQKISNFLCDYQSDHDWCREVGINRRTSARYRNVESPGLPYIKLGGRNYIHVANGREWLAKRTQHRNKAE